MTAAGAGISGSAGRWQVAPSVQDMENVDRVGSRHNRCLKGVKQKCIGLLAAQSTMVADQFFHGRYSAVCVEGAVDDEVAGMGKIGDATRLPGPQLDRGDPLLGKRLQRIVALDCTGVQIAPARFAQYERNAIVVVANDETDALMVHKRFHHARVGQVQFASGQLTWLQVKIDLGKVAAAADNHLGL